MKIAVMGAGAVGCFYGGMLARAGHSVTLIGRAQHVAAIRAKGLHINALTFQESVPIGASTEATAVADADIVLFCVKSTDTETAGALMLPHLSPHTVIYSLQNGVDNAARLANTLGRPVVPVVVYVAAEMSGIGEVRHHGRGELVIGPYEGAQHHTETFARAGIPTRISDNVMGALWAKLIVNCAFNALSAVSQRPYGELFASFGVADVMRDVVRECLAVASACGVDVPGDSWQAVEQIAHSMPGQRSSTAQDIARQKHTEIDYLNGFVVREGARFGIATPVNRTLHAMVRTIEARFADDTNGAA